MQFFYHKLYCKVLFFLLTYLAKYITFLSFVFKENLKLCSVTLFIFYILCLQQKSAKQFGCFMLMDGKVLLFKEKIIIKVFLRENYKHFYNHPLPQKNHQKVQGTLCPSVSHWQRSIRELGPCFGDFRNEMRDIQKYQGK